MNYIDCGDHIEAEGLYIPKDAENADYAAFLAWVEAGNTPSLPEEEPPRPPGSVTMRQARLALLEAGGSKCSHRSDAQPAEGGRTD